MRGGAVIALAGAFDIDAGEGIKAESGDQKLLDLLDAYGVGVRQSFVMDPQNTPLPVPVNVKRGQYTIRSYRNLPYPFFADIRREGFADRHAALNGVDSVTMTWASPLELKAIDGVESEVLLKTSAGSWLQGSPVLEPDFQQYPEAGFAPADADSTSEKVVAATLRGAIPSYFADKPSPLFIPDAKPEGDLEDKADRTGRTMKQSTPDARLVVLASADVVGDAVASLSMQPSGGAYRGNLLLVRNLIDWTLEDTDLLQIRSAGAFARTLRKMDDAERWKWQLGNYGFVLAALLGVLGVAITRRRMARPIPLEDA